MKTIDITFDLETCATCPTAAVMSVSAVAWDRFGESSPFFTLDDQTLDRSYIFDSRVDLSGMYLDGFTFDLDTQNWWKNQNPKAKHALVDPDKECYTVNIVLQNFFAWIEEMKTATGSDHVNLWCQGTDFDVAILKHICHFYGLTLPVTYPDFRDHRTFFAEGARIICDMAHVDFDIRKISSLVEEYSEEDGLQHEAVFDCKRSIFRTWQMMQHLRCVIKQ